MIFNYKYLAYLWSLVFFEGDVISDVLKYGKGVSSDASWKMLYLMTQTIAMMKSVMTYSLDRPVLLQTRCSCFKPCIWSRHRNYWWCPLNAVGCHMIEQFSTDFLYEYRQRVSRSQYTSIQLPLPFYALCMMLLSKTVWSIHPRCKPCLFSSKAIKFHSLIWDEK